MARRTPPDDPRKHWVVNAWIRGDTGALIKALADPDVRSLAARWLADAGEKAAIPGLMRLLDADDPPVRMVAAESLGKLKASEAAERLLELAESDPAPSVRSWAIYVVGQLAAAGELGGRAIVPLLISFLDDPEWKVRNGASAALSLIADPRALRPLREAFRRERGFKNRYLTRRGYRTAIAAITRNNPS